MLFISFSFDTVLELLMFRLQTNFVNELRMCMCQEEINNLLK